MPEILTIQETSRKANVSKHTLRFWEKELNGIIVPLRTKGGQRRYTPYHLYIIKEIKRLKKEGLSLLDIKRRFDSNNSRIEKNDDSNKIDMLADQIAEAVKSAIYNFLAHEQIKNSD
jgi:DNA-binding transcriptional MerR regulator